VLLIKRERRRGLSTPPLPDAVACFLVDGVTGKAKQEHSLTAMMSLVSDEIADESRRVWFEALDSLATGDRSIEEYLDCSPRFLQAFDQQWVSQRVGIKFADSLEEVRRC